MNILGAKRQYGRIVGFFLPILILFGAILFQLRYDSITYEHYDIHAPVHRFILPAPIVDKLSFGFQNTLADYYWITAVQDFLKWDHKDVYYPEYFRIISALDPKFEYPYMFAILTLPAKNNTTSLEWMKLITDKGIQNIPESWQIPFYAGVEYQVVAHSYPDATKYIEIAKQKKSHPELVDRTYAIYLMHDRSEYQKSRALFEAMYQTSDNAETKRVVKERLDLLDLIEMLDQASAKYKQLYGAYPQSLIDLSEKHLVNIPLEIAKKFKLQIDQTSGHVILPR